MSAWDEARLGGRAGQRFALGLWHPLHKMGSLAWMPPASERLKIAGKQRYVYAITIPLGPNESEADRFTVVHDFWLTDIASDYDAGATSNTPFSLQLFETRTGIRYVNYPIIGPAFAGDNQEVDTQIEGGGDFTMPYFQRRITKIPGGSVMQMTIQNLFGPAVTLNTVQVALGGYQ